MSKKRRTYLAKFKAKVVLELLEDGKTIMSLHLNMIYCQNLYSFWKRQFFENTIPVKKYRDVIEEKMTWLYFSTLSPLLLSKDIINLHKNVFQFNMKTFFVPRSIARSEFIIDL